MSTTMQVRPKVQLGTQITKPQSILLARLKVELKARGLRKSTSLGELVGEGIELLAEKYGL